MSKDITTTQQLVTQDQPIIEDNQLQDTRSIDEMREALSKAEALAKSAGEEAKKYRQTMSQIKAEKEAAEKAKLEAEGNWKALADQAAERAKLEEEGRKKDRAQFAFTQIKSALEVEAAKHGCKDTKALIKLVDLSDVEVDEHFMPNVSKLQDKVLEQMKAREYLFAKPAPSVRDAAPASGKPAAGKAIKDMTSAELIEMYKKLNG